MSEEQDVVVVRKVIPRTKSVADVVPLGATQKALDPRKTFHCYDSPVCRAHRDSRCLCPAPERYPRPTIHPSTLDILFDGLD